MRRKGSHTDYELMFEEMLRRSHVPYIAVDEQRRPVTRWGAIKNFDFIVHSSAGNYLVDIKGKQFPQEIQEGKSRLWWQNWIHDSDLEGIAFWKDIFGAQFTPLLVYTYQVLYVDLIFQFNDLFNFRENSYGLVACTFDDYRKHAQVRSEKWKAWYVKKKVFLEIIRPLREYIPEIVS